jgi:hypothetical protein
VAQRSKHLGPLAGVLFASLSLVSAAPAEAQVPDFLLRTGLFADTSGRMNELDREIATQVSRVEQLEAERARAEAEVTALTTRRAETNRRLRDRARALYRLTHAGALPLSGGFPALLAHLGRRARLERIVLADLEAMDDLRARASVLREESSDRAAQLEEVREALRTLGGGGMMGGGMTGAPGGVVASGPTYGLSRSPVVEAEGYGLRVVDGTAPSGPSFESQRGQLMIPLLAPTGMREATREEGAGLEISGAAGTSVRAAAPAPSKPAPGSACRPPRSIDRISAARAPVGASSGWPG